MEEKKLYKYLLGHMISLSMWMLKIRQHVIYRREEMAKLVLEVKESLNFNMCKGSY